MLPVADEIGATPWLRVPERNAAERQIAQRAGGASLEEIYAEQVGATAAGAVNRCTTPASFCIIPRADARSASLCVGIHPED